MKIQSKWKWFRNFPRISKVKKWIIYNMSSFQKHQESRVAIIKYKSQLGKIYFIKIEFYKNKIAIKKISKYLWDRKNKRMSHEQLLSSLKDSLYLQKFWLYICLDSFVIILLNWENFVLNIWGHQRSKNEQYRIFFIINQIRNQFILD